MKNKSIILTAISGIIVLEIIALLKGIDGALFGFVIAAISGLAGWTAPQPKFLNK